MPSCPPCPQTLHPSCLQCLQYENAGRHAAEKHSFYRLRGHSRALPWRQVQAIALFLSCLVLYSLTVFNSAGDRLVAFGRLAGVAGALSLLHRTFSIFFAPNFVWQACSTFCAASASASFRKVCIPLHHPPLASSSCRHTISRLLHAVPQRAFLFHGAISVQGQGHCARHLRIHLRQRLAASPHTHGVRLHGLRQRLQRRSRNI